MCFGVIRELILDLSVPPVCPQRYNINLGSSVLQAVRSHLIPGSCVPIPNVERLPDSDILGRGGNGKTFRHLFMGQEFAVKWVSSPNY